MGFSSGLLDFMVECAQDYGLSRRSAVLDVGTSELFCGNDPLSLNRFLSGFGAPLYEGNDLEKMAQRGLAADLLMRAGFSYTAIDFADYPHTLRVDLNIDGLPAGYRSAINSLRIRALANIFLINSMFSKLSTRPPP